MPMPTPTDNDTVETFMKKFMTNAVMVKDYPDEKQRYAVGMQQWKKRNGTKAQEWIDGLMLGEAEPKDEIMLFPFGEFEHAKYGKLKFDAAFFNEIIDNFKKNVLGIQPFIDQEHDAGKALAWFSDVPYVRQGVGLFIKPEWTKLGRELLSEKIYKYFSPWFEDFRDPATGKVHKNVLRGGAATNIPFLKTMPAIVNDVQLSESVSISLSEIKESVNGVVAVNAAAQGAGVKSAASEAGAQINDINSANKINIGGVKMTLEELQKEHDKVLAELKKANEKIIELNASVKLADEKIIDNKKLSETIEAQGKQLAEMKAEKVVAKALSEGRILPKDVEYWQKRMTTSPEVEADIAHMPVAIALGEKGVEGASSEEDSDPATKLHQMAVKLSEEKKISYGKAYDIVKMAEKDLAEKAAKTQYSRRG